MYLYCPFWAHLVFVNLQVDNQGLLLKSEQEESLSPTTKSSLKRQTVTDLKGQQKKANQAKQNVTEQGEKVQGASVSRPTAFQTDGYHHQPYTQTQLLPQPYSNLQTHHNKSLTLPSDASIDLPKVCWIIFQHTVFVYIDATWWKL